MGRSLMFSGVCVMGFAAVGGLIALALGSAWWAAVFAGGVVGAFIVAMCGFVVSLYEM